MSSGVNGGLFFDVRDLMTGYDRAMPLISIPRMQVFSGQVVGICGANGSGKSTLIKAFLGLAPYVEGSLLVNGNDVPRLRPEIIARRLRVGYLPQHSRVFANLSVEENIAVACRGADQRQRVETLLSQPEYKILRTMSKAPAQGLSGGEALMLGLACLEAFEPEIIFLDEPTAGADQVLRSLFFNLILRWSKEEKGIVLVEQDHAALLKVAELCYALVPVPATSATNICQPAYVVLPIPKEQYGRIRSQETPGELMEIVSQMSENGLKNLSNDMEGGSMLAEPKNPPVILEKDSITPNRLSILSSEFLHAVVLPSIGIIIPVVIGYSYIYFNPKYHFEFEPFREATVLLITLVIVGSICFRKLFKKFKSLQQKAGRLHKAIEELYAQGFPLIRTGIIHEMKENAVRFRGRQAVWNQQKKYDEQIVTPLEYCKNLISGEYQPPEFKPDEEYINLLFHQEQVIAITGAPVAMWMDPTLGFYLVNGCLASLIGHVNKQLSTRHSGFDGIKENCCKLVASQNRTPMLSDDYKNQNQELLAKLADGEDLSGCGSFAARFFIISEQDRKTSVTLLDSLYALHELFGVNAYFVTKIALLKKLTEAMLQDDYTNTINGVWNAIYTQNEIKSQEKPSNPEFLIFPQQSDGAASGRVFTYQQTKPVDALAPDSLKLVKILAGICKNAPEDDELWYKPGTTSINQNNCFVNVE